MTAQTIYSTLEAWRPRYYYIKRNKTTNKLYVGQTVQHVEKYLGSGVDWVKHCIEYGGYNKENIETVWFQMFENESKAQEFLNSFEEQNPNYYMEENKTWANMVPETTEDSPFMQPMPDNMKKKISKTLTGAKKETSTKNKMSKSKKKNRYINDGSVNKQWPKNKPVPDGWFEGRKPISEAHKKNIGISGTGRTWKLEAPLNISDEERIKRSEKMKKLAARKTKCSYCEKTGNEGAMKRWHFDNCKHKK